MRELEARDARDRSDGTPRLDRLRQVPPETGQFLALLAASARPGGWIEIGTSAGYSSMWIALACRERDRILTTFEVLASKAVMARETIEFAQIGDVVRLVEGDFLNHVDQLGDVAFCFLDAEKEVYESCYDAIVPRLVPGGLLVADNAINHAATLQPLIDRARRTDREGRVGLSQAPERGRFIAAVRNSMTLRPRRSRKIWLKVDVKTRRRTSC
ncbi:MAG TPA: class I SAM-dependent methyltransferase [Acidimicrobiales bacterium]